MIDKETLDRMTKEIIGIAIRVHRQFGTAVFERVYETYFYHGLLKAGFTVERQKSMSVEFEGITMERAYRLDLLVENAIIIEVKAVETLLEVHRLQLLAYLKLSGYPLGLLINFHAPTIRSQLKRYANF